VSFLWWPLPLSPSFMLRDNNHFKSEIEIEMNWKEKFCWIKYEEISRKEFFCKHGIFPKKSSFQIRLQLDFDSHYVLCFAVAEKCNHKRLFSQLKGGRKLFSFHRVYVVVVVGKFSDVRQRCDIKRGDTCIKTERNKKNLLSSFMSWSVSQL
jgi:hypothetical protein